MVFFIILIAVFSLSLITSVILDKKTRCDCEIYTIFLSFALFVCTALFIALMVCRKINIHTYYEVKSNPQYFTNQNKIEDNQTISKMKAHQGTIFSFYNGIEFEYFEIEDGSKVIIKE